MLARLMTSAAVLAVATPAFAADLYAPTLPPANDPIYAPQPLVMGHLMMGIGFLDAGNISDFDDISSFDDTVGLFVGAGRANVNLGGTWNIEFETGGFSLFNNGNSYSSIGAAGHVWTKLANAAVGVYGGVNFPTAGTIYTLGLEGEVYFGAFTLGADVDYNWTDGFLGGIGDFWGASGWVDAYFTPDWRLGGEVEYYGDNVDTWNFSLDTEYRFSGTPFSAWLEGNYIKPSGGPDIWSGLIGFRVFMDGGQTLIDHDRNVPWESGLLGPDQFGP